jgi:hypothetical protein
MSFWLWPQQDCQTVAVGISRLISASRFLSLQPRAEDVSASKIQLILFKVIRDEHSFNTQRQRQSAST